MIYNINGTSIQSLGWHPLAERGQSLALRGIFDLPRRMGDTEHNWGDVIEPFIDSEDIIFQDQMITFHLVTYAGSKSELVNRIEALLYRFTSGSVEITSELDSVSVQMPGDAIIDRRLLNNIAIARLNLVRYNYVPPALSVPQSGGTGWRLNNYNLAQDLNIHISNRVGLLDFSSANIDNYTAKPTNLFNRNAKDTTLRCVLEYSSFADLQLKMNRINSVLSSSGAKTITDPQGTSYNVYIKNGTTVRQVYKNMCIFDLRIRKINYEVKFFTQITNSIPHTQLDVANGDILEMEVKTSDILFMFLGSADSFVGAVNATQTTINANTGGNLSGSLMYVDEVLFTGTRGELANLISDNEIHKVRIVINGSVFNTFLFNFSGWSYTGLVSPVKHFNASGALINTYFNNPTVKG